MGVWIEISHPSIPKAMTKVTPFVGVWIEMISASANAAMSSVTPFVGVWIEIGSPVLCDYTGKGHSLRGSVD